jgi:hypothetical protein
MEKKSRVITHSELKAAYNAMYRIPPRKTWKKLPSTSINSAKRKRTPLLQTAVLETPCLCELCEKNQAKYFLTATDSAGLRCPECGRRENFSVRVCGQRRCRWPDEKLTIHLNETEKSDSFVAFNGVCFQCNTYYSTEHKLEVRDITHHPIS